MERFVKMLEPERRGLGLDVWVDRAIATGREWRPEIAAAIARADVALLLVSPDFVASPFILERELPALVAREVPLACALLRRCRYAAVDELERVQWAHDPVRDGPIAMAGDVDGDRRRRRGARRHARRRSARRHRLDRSAWTRRGGAVQPAAGRTVLHRPRGRARRP